MAKCVIGYGDLVSAGIVTASSEASPSLAAVNLQDPRVSARRWRAADTAPSILVDFTYVATIGALALGGCNLTSASTRRVRLSVDDPSGLAGEAWDSGSDAVGAELGFPCGVRERTQLVHILPADVAARYARIDLTGALPPEAGRLWCWPTFRPGVNFAFSAQDVRKPYSDFRAAQDGTAYGEKRPIQHGYKINLPHITEDEKDLYLDPLLESSDILYDVMLCKDPEAVNVASRTMIGTLESLSPVPNQHYRWWATELTVWERM
jgi:hypothetical protein